MVCSPRLGGERQKRPQVARPGNPRTDRDRPGPHRRRRRHARVRRRRGGATGRRRARRGVRGRGDRGQVPHAPAPGRDQRPGARGREHRRRADPRPGRDDLPRLLRRRTAPSRCAPSRPGLANPNRPVWILEQDYPKFLEPGISPKELDDEPTAGAEAAQTNTFSFGALAPGDELTAVWRVTPVQGGTYTVNYEIAAGLTGKAQAVTADGSPAEGSFVVTIDDQAARGHGRARRLDQDREVAPRPGQPSL